MAIDPKDEKIQEGELTDDQADRVAGGISQGDADNSDATYRDPNRFDARE